MPLPTDFHKTLAEKTDEHLFDMLAHPDDYLPEALMVARGEIKRRNLGPAIITQLEQRSEIIRTQELQIANEPLSWFVGIIIAILPLGILLMFILAYAYRSSGYTKKSKECWKWWVGGVVVWVMFIFLAKIA